MQLTLDPQDAALLLDVLTDTLSNLRAEIVDTDSYDYRQALKAREVRLRAIIARLQALAAAESGPPPSGGSS
jgi:hypothetical protein